MHVSCLAGLVPRYHAFRCLILRAAPLFLLSSLPFRLWEKAAVALSSTFAISGAALCEGKITRPAHTANVFYSSLCHARALPTLLLVGKRLITELLLLGWAIEQMIPRSRLNALGEEIKTD